MTPEMIIQTQIKLDYNFVFFLRLNKNIIIIII